MTLIRREVPLGHDRFNRIAQVAWIAWLVMASAVGMGRVPGSPGTQGMTRYGVGTGEPPELGPPPVPVPSSQSSASNVMTAFPRPRQQKHPQDGLTGRPPNGCFTDFPGMPGASQTASGWPPGAA
jgi:hypothetical protein